MPPGKANPCLYVIDAHALIFQVFHAIPGMSSPRGLPTNALFGFTRDLLFLRNDVRPDFLLCAFDVAGPTFRDELYPEYKAHRSPMPDDLQLQISEIHKLLEAMRIPVIGQPGYEADDLIATVATAAERQGFDVFICTSDKDARQLLDDRIRIYNLRKREVFDRAALQRDWGIRPDQVVDLQALAGDAVDNVPGVPGIGVKTAAKLLQEYQTLDNVLAACDAARSVAAVPAGGKRAAAAKPRGALSPRLVENVCAVGDKIALSRQLVRLATDVPLKIDWDAWRLQDWDAARLLALFREWGFHRFADQVRAAGGNRPSAIGPPGGEAGASVTVDSPSVQGELFPYGANVAGDVAPPTEPADSRQPIAESRPPAADRMPLAGCRYELVNTPEEYRTFLKALRKQKRFAIDLETTSLEPRRADVVGYAVCWQPGEAWYLAVRGPAGEPVLDPDRTLAELRPILEDPSVAKVNQNIKYDLIVLRQQGVAVAGVAGDPMVADYLLHAGERNHSMEVLAQQYLHHDVIPITDLIGKKGKKQLRMDQVPTARVAVYAGEDADVAWRLCDLLEPELQERGWKRPAGDRRSAIGRRLSAADHRAPSAERRIYLYDDLEIPLIEVLAELEFNGIRLDVPLLRRLGGQMERELKDIEKEIYRLAGHEFNIASLKQLRQVLFDELKLPVQRRTGITSEASTDQATLERLAALKDNPAHEVPKKILEHRRIAKLKGTYVDALPELVNPATGRVHTSFNQTVAATGRLSSSDPNLQNIPVRREQGQQIRQAFVPQEGWVLLTADYSQIELRLLAHFCGDPGLRHAFALDHDIHASVAAQIFNVPEKDVTRNMRRVAKTVNFGVIYGISAFGLAPRLEISKEEAARFIDAYFQRYPKVLEYQTRLLEDARRNGYVATLLGRRRPFDPKGIRPDSTYQQRNQPEREAINMEIQGSAADLIKVAMLNVFRRLRREERQARMLLQIHDELVFEVPPEELKAVGALVAEEMSGALAPLLSVPLKVDLAAGPNWLDVEELPA
jgi:DNA polymerase-1